MKPADRKAFLEIVVGFAELKGRQLSAPALELYWRSMQDWSLEDFRAAAEQLIRTCEFMPTPKDFEDLRKSMRPTAAEAWLTARRAVESCRVPGGYGPGGTCGDALIDRAVQAIGGYRAIALCDSDRLGYLERRFAEHYEALQDAEDVREALPQLATRSPPRRLLGPVSAKESLPSLPQPARASRS